MSRLSSPIMILFSIFVLSLISATAATTLDPKGTFVAISAYSKPGCAGDADMYMVQQVGSCMNMLGLDLSYYFSVSSGGAVTQYMCDDAACSGIIKYTIKYIL